MLSAEWLTEQILLEGCSHFRLFFSITRLNCLNFIHHNLIKAVSDFTNRPFSIPFIVLIYSTNMTEVCSVCTAVLESVLFKRVKYTYANRQEYVQRTHLDDLCENRSIFFVDESTLISKRLKSFKSKITESRDVFTLPLCAWILQLGYILFVRMLQGAKKEKRKDKNHSSKLTYSIWSKVTHRKAKLVLEITFHGCFLKAFSF